MTAYKPHAGELVAEWVTTSEPANPQYCIFFDFYFYCSDLRKRSRAADSSPPSAYSPECSEHHYSRPGYPTRWDVDVYNVRQSGQLYKQAVCITLIAQGELKMMY